MQTNGVGMRPYNFIYTHASNASSQIEPLDCSLATTVKQCGREKNGDADWFLSEIQNILCFILRLGLPLWLSWERICLQCGRPGFNPWVGKIPWRRETLPTSVFWPIEFHGLYSPRGQKESDKTLTFTDLKKIPSLYPISSCVLSSWTSFSVSPDRVSFLFFTLYYYDCQFSHLPFLLNNGKRPALSSN